jgi:hypothetical protein
VTRQLALAFLLSSHALADEVWLKVDFSARTSTTGWHRDGEEWKLTEDGISINSPQYDRMFAHEMFIPGTMPFSMTATMRGAGAGLYFSLDDTTSNTYSQMVRFEGKSILSGYFNGAREYTATGVFDVGTTPDRWTTLRIDVHPGKGWYEIFVDDIAVGRDTTLRFASGYVGLQASGGVSEFREIAITAATPPKPPPQPAIGSQVTLAHVARVRSSGEHLIIVSPELSAVQTIDTLGRLLERGPLSTAPSPRRSAVIGGAVYSISGNRIFIGSHDGVITDSITHHLVSPAELVADRQFLYVADPGLGSILKFDRTGRMVAAFSGRALGGLKAPRGIDLYGQGDLVIADYDRLLMIPRSLEETLPEVHHLGPDRVQISWPGVSSSIPFLLSRTDNGNWTRQRGIVLYGRNSVTLSRLPPLTRHSFRFSPVGRIVSQTETLSREFRFTTEPQDSFALPYTHLPVLLMVYRTMSYRDAYPAADYPHIPWGRTITDDEIAYLKEAARFNEEFYFRNSGCRVVLDFDFYVVSDTLWLRDLGPADPYWLPANERVTRDYEAACASLGKQPQDYAGLICPYAWVNYPPRRTSALRDPSVSSTDINIRQAYGGGTNGVPAPWKYGRTTGYTANPFQDRFSRQDWLITHEFHHQIDALMEASGYAEYYHADQPWKMPGAFGEDFDFNARIIRNAEQHWWLDLKFGTVRTAKDADRDGMPDDDASLPFDERRLGASPAAVDTDGDGLSDLAEFMAGTSRSADPRNPDTDGDMIPDGTDEWPLYPIIPVVCEYLSSSFADLQPFGAIATDSLAASFRAGWNREGMTMAVQCNTPPPPFLGVLIQIDAENDGWFHGFDNYQLRASLSDDSMSVAEFYLRDCSSRINPPGDRKDILHHEDVTLVRDALKRGSFFIRIPADPAHGLTMEKGKRLAIRLGIQSTPDRWVWVELLERNAMMPVELTR